VSLPYFMFYPADFLSDLGQQALTTEQCGAYIRVLCAMWNHNNDREEWRGLPENDTILARITGVSVRRWRRISEVLLDEFSPVIQRTPEFLTNKRIEKEWNKAKGRREKCSIAGSKSLKSKERTSTIVEPSPIDPSTIHIHNKKHIQNKNKNNKPSAKKALPKYTEEFLFVWNVWMESEAHQIGSGPGVKSMASKSWEKVIGSPDANFLVLITDSIRKYLQDCINVGSKTQHLSTWLNQRAWEDWAQREPRQHAKSINKPAFDYAQSLANKGTRGDITERDWND